MEIDIKKQTENTLLNRTEINFSCLYQGEATPKVLDVKNRLVAVLNVNKDLLVVDKLKPSFGTGRAECYAKLYDSPESLSRIERDHVVQKNQEAASEEAEEK
ncbi:MAG: 30S ribosomal protein S24e [Methanobacteriales archaeon Met13]